MPPSVWNETGIIVKASGNCQSRDGPEELFAAVGEGVVDGADFDEAVDGRREETGVGEGLFNGGGVRTADEQVAAFAGMGPHGGFFGLFAAGGGFGDAQGEAGEGGAAGAGIHGGAHGAVSRAFLADEGEALEVAGGGAGGGVDAAGGGGQPTLDALKERLQGAAGG